MFEIIYELQFCCIAYLLFIAKMSNVSVSHNMLKNFLKCCGNDCNNDYLMEESMETNVYAQVNNVGKAMPTSQVNKHVSKAPRTLRERLMLCGENCK